MDAFSDADEGIIQTTTEGSDVTPFMPALKCYPCNAQYQKLADHSKHRKWLL